MRMSNQSRLFFIKKQVLLELTIFFVWKKEHIPTKVITYSRNYIKKKDSSTLDIFLNFSNVKNYVTFKLFAWAKRLYNIFELWILRESINLILERSYKVLPRKAKIVTLQQLARLLWEFYHWIFKLPLHWKYYNFSTTT